LAGIAEGMVTAARADECGCGAGRRVLRDEAPCRP